VATERYVARRAGPFASAEICFYPWCLLACVCVSVTVAGIVLKRPDGSADFRTVQSIVCLSMSVCLSTLSVRSYNWQTTRPNFTKFLVCVTYGRGSVLLWRLCDRLRYVLPVLWMTSCFHIMAVWHATCIPKWRQNKRSVTTEFYSPIKTSK